MAIKRARRRYRNIQQLYYMKYKYIYLLCLLMVAGLSVQAQTQQQRLENHVYYMAADSLRGRSAGSADAQKVADYIEREFVGIGLQPLYGSNRLYFTSLGYNRIVPISSAKAEADKHKTKIYRDVVGVIPGSDPVLKDEYIVVGGHYDHLGVRDGKVYNGADDNASGTACVIELARQLVAQRPARTVIVCAFDGEEIGLYGSKALAAKMLEMNDLGKVKMMLSIDMVGWLKQGKSLRLEGTGTLKGCEAMLNGVAEQVGINIRGKRFESSPFTATDTEPFARHGIPTLAVTTGLKSPYHKPEDDANLIDYPGLDKVTNYMSALVMRMASQQEAMASSGKVASKHNDRPKPFEVGLMAGYTMSKVTFPNSMFDAKSKMGFAGGISTNINFSKYFGLQIDFLAELSNMPYPQANDIFGSHDVYKQTGLLLPVQLHALLGRQIGLGFGGYYGYAVGRKLVSSNAVNSYDAQYQYGLVWSIEERLANLSLDFTFYYQLNDLLTPPPASAIPTCRRNAFTFTLGWYF